MILSAHGLTGHFNRNTFCFFMEIFKQPIMWQRCKISSHAYTLQECQLLFTANISMERIWSLSMACFYGRKNKNNKNIINNIQWVAFLRCKKGDDWKKHCLVLKKNSTIQVQWSCVHFLCISHNFMVVLHMFDVDNRSSWSLFVWFCVAFLPHEWLVVYLN